jgi:AcrR family transcriptional regulator
MTTARIGKSGTRVVRRLKTTSGDASAARANILAVAIREFSEKGLAGARVDEIGKKISASRRMIYYYFKSKVGLYRAVLEHCYTQIRRIDTAPALDSLPPTEALRAIVRQTFDYHTSHPEFVRIVMNENIHLGEHIGRVAHIKAMSAETIERLRRLIERGVAAGVFRPDLEPVELHMTISALSFYNVSNRYTFGAIFGRDMSSNAAVQKRREVVVEIIERWARHGA